MEQGMKIKMVEELVVTLVVMAVVIVIVIVIVIVKELIESLVKKKKKIMKVCWFPSLPDSNSTIKIINNKINTNNNMNQT